MKSSINDEIVTSFTANIMYIQERLENLHTKFGMPLWSYNAKNMAKSISSKLKHMCWNTDFGHVKKFCKLTVIIIFLDTFTCVIITICV